MTRRSLRLGSHRRAYAKQDWQPAQTIVTFHESVSLHFVLDY